MNLELFVEQYIEPARELAEKSWALALPQSEQIFELMRAGSQAYPLQTITVVAATLIAALFGRSLSVLLAGLCMSGAMLVALSPVVGGAQPELLSGLSVAGVAFLLIASFGQWLRKSAQVHAIRKMDEDHDETRAKLEGEKRWRLATEEFESKFEKAAAKPAMEPEGA